MFKEFSGKNDWTKDVHEVRVKKMLHPKADLDGDGIDDDEQNKAEVTGAGFNGQVVNGVYFTQEQVEEIYKQREIDYFNLLELAKKINYGLNGKLTEHSVPEKISKIKTIEDHHKNSVEHENTL